jgi:MoaA/NifB/PqqE/SkfB family radical SAM enzyme
MSVAMFDAIMDKIARETPNVPYIGLFSWTEPLLHPELSQIVANVKQHGFACYLSSNLNRIDRLEEVIAAKPDRFRISLSGFTQEIYEQTHRGGNIETVKANMHRLREILDEQGSEMPVFVSYLRYRHNMGRELEAMRALVEKLRFNWEPVWAYLMPVEKNLDYYEGRIADADKKVIELLAVSPDEHKQLRKDSAPCDCRLRSDEMSINADGSVALCCGTFDKKYTISPSFLDTSFEQLQKLKYSHSLCEACMSHEMHKTAIMTEPDRMEAIARRNLGIKPTMREQADELLKEIRPRLALGTKWRAITRQSTKKTQD